MSHDPQTKADVQRRTLEGRTKEETLRSLKRNVTRQVNRTLTAISGGLAVFRSILVPVEDLS